jgi:polyhydroxybutyrate depolymerase
VCAGAASLVALSSCHPRPSGGAGDAGSGAGAGAVISPKRNGATPSATALAPSDRPYGLHTPRGWSRAAPAPLVVFFHGYGSTGASSVAGFGLTTLSDANGFVLAYPDGVIDGQGRRFWNATNACCDFGDRGIDDVAYAAWLIDDVAATMPIDPQRVYVVGHSNGGFLALRLACDLAPRIAAAVSLAGAAWEDPSRCRPAHPVSVLQIQGDADAVVHFGGGLVFDRPARRYPGALATVGTFAAAEGCTGALAPAGAALDFDALVPGAETHASEFRGCPPGISVGLWTVAGGSHAPSPTPDGLAALWAWMAAHPRR